MNAPRVQQSGAVDVASELRNAMEALESSADSFETIQALMRWVDEAARFRQREFGQDVWPDDVGHLRSLLEPFTQSQAGYSQNGREHVVKAMRALGLEPLPEDA